MMAGMLSTKFTSAFLTEVQTSQAMPRTATMNKRNTISMEKALMQKTVLMSLKRGSKHQMSLQSLPYTKKNPHPTISFPQLTKSSSLLKIRAESQMSKTRKKLHDTI